MNPGYQPYAPPPRRSNDSCWKWGALSCIGCGCLSVIAFVIFSVVIANSPVGHRFVNSVTSVASATQNMVRIKVAMQRYVADHGSYPQRLRDLVPTYLPSDTLLRPAGAPPSDEFKYTKPAADAPGETVVVSYTVPNPVNESVGPANVIVLRKDGRVETVMSTPAQPRQIPRGER